MKKIIYISILIILTLLSSCNDAIEIEQVGRLRSDEAYQDLTDLNEGLIGLYGGFDYTSQIQFNSVFTDEVAIGPVNGGQGIGNGEYGFRLDPQSAISGALWSRYYGRLNAATRLIEGAKALDIASDPEAEPADVEEFNRILGEAYALRAWAHFELLTYFSEDLRDDSSPGIIILDFIPPAPLPDNLQLPRNTTGEVFNVIEADLTLAEGLITDQSNTFTVSLDFIIALRARMALYRGRYMDADTFAADLLSRYPLTVGSSAYRSMFTDASVGEVIFKLDRVNNDGFDAQGATGSAAAGGWPGAIFSFTSVTNGAYYQMSRVLFETLSPNDARYNALLHPDSDLVDRIYFIRKYERSDGQNLMNDLKIFRASEMMLIRAEVAAQNNDLVAAAGFVDQIREARFDDVLTNPVYANQQEAFLRILQERQIEFAYEGHRWLDLRRLGPQTPLTEMTRNSADCEINSACSLPFSDLRFQYLPIPLAETNANLQISQNTGY